MQLEMPVKILPTRFSYRINRTEILLFYTKIEILSVLTASSLFVAKETQKGVWYKLYSPKTSIEINLAEIKY